jgi:hypothetical protein
MPRDGSLTLSRRPWAKPDDRLRAMPAGVGATLAKLIEQHSDAKLTDLLPNARKRARPPSMTGTRRSTATAAVSLARKRSRMAGESNSGREFWAN